MKKANLLCVMAAASLFLLTACGGGGGTTTDSENSSAASEGAGTAEVQEGELKEVSREKTLFRNWKEIFMIHLWLMQPIMMRKAASYFRIIQLLKGH